MASGKSSKGRGKKRPPARRPPTPAKAPGTTGGPKAPGTTGGPKAPGVAAPATGHQAGQQAGQQAPVKAKVTRAERLDAARRARKRKAFLTRAGIAGVVALLSIVVSVVVINNRKDAKADQERLTAGSCTYDTRADDTKPAPNNHTPPAGYEVDPPAGGNHAPAAAAGGLYDAEGQTPPPDPQLVHSLEHGFVVLWHRPDLSEEELADVRRVFDDHPEDVIVVPRASLQGKVAATSWGRRLLCGEVEPDALSEFVDLYRNKSPEPGVR